MTYYSLQNSFTKTTQKRIMIEYIDKNIKEKK